MFELKRGVPPLVAGAALEGLSAFCLCEFVSELIGEEAVGSTSWVGASYIILTALDDPFAECEADCFKSRWAEDFFNF